MRAWTTLKRTNTMHYGEIDRHNGMETFCGYYFNPGELKTGHPSNSTRPCKVCLKSAIANQLISKEDLIIARNRLNDETLYNRIQKLIEELDNGWSPQAKK